jgi:predicted RNase H-like HicB family nuclease
MKPTDMNIKVLIERGKDGYLVAHAPALKSCWSQGVSKAEALENIREAIELYLEPNSLQVRRTDNQ